LLYCLLSTFVGIHVALFDSGIGGLTVLHKAIEILPYENYIYYADTDHVPYGTKTKDQITDHVNHAAKFLSQFDLKALVLACNTATSVVVRDLRKRYNFPIIGMEPAVKPAITQSNKRVLVCATERTLQEEKLHNLILDLDADTRVTLLPLQELVKLAEDSKFEYFEVQPVLERSLGGIDWHDYEYLVLGCTHFLFFKEAFSYYLPPWIKIIDGNEGTILHLKSVITPQPTPTQFPIKYYQSDRESESAYFEQFLKKLDS